MACNPPNCLEIPPASPPSGKSFPVCRWHLTWYRVWPITFDLSDSGAGSEATLATALNGIANAGGRLLDLDVSYLDSSGACTLTVSTIYPTPGNPNPSGSGQPQVTCPPGFVYDPVAEACVLEAIVVTPPPPPGPPPPGPPPPGPPPPPSGGCPPVQDVTFWSVVECARCLWDSAVAAFVCPVCAFTEPGVLTPVAILACLKCAWASIDAVAACGQCAKLQFSDIVYVFRFFDCFAHLFSSRKKDPPMDFLESRFLKFPRPQPSTRARKSIVEAHSASLARVFMSNPSNRANRDLPGR